MDRILRTGARNREEGGMKKPVEKRVAVGLAGMEVAYPKGKDLLEDARTIIEAARGMAYRAVNAALVQRNWLLGKRIAEEELEGKRAEYGRKVIGELAAKLTEEYGAGFSMPALYQFTEFYRAFPILYSLRIKSGDILTWTHYRILLQVKNGEVRDWYKEEAGSETWSVRTLQRNISSQYYERTLLSQAKGAVKAEMKRLTAPLQDRLEFIKNPVVAEFLGLAPRTDFTESDLETRILDNLGKFLMELGKGFAFVARQQRIHTEKEDYYVDLVFYNYLLKCFVLIDLKTSKISHQDVGQMDMYVRMFDERRRGEGDNPTLGIILCADTDSDVARYSVLKGSEQLFASKYRLMLPSEEELRAEIEAQKAIFEAQHGGGEIGQDLQDGGRRKARAKAAKCAKGRGKFSRKCAKAQGMSEATRGKCEVTR